MYIHTYIYIYISKITHLFLNELYYFEELEETDI